MDGMKPVEIKPLTAEDDRDAVGFCREIYSEMGWPEDGLGSSIAEIFSEFGDAFVTVKQNGRIIGTAGLLRLSKEQALLKRFYLAKRVRGSGLATRLFADLVERARAMGYSALLLDVSSTNGRAIRFYKKEGMEEFFSISPHPRWAGSSPERQKTDRYFRLKL
ncbi:hypothetical protein COU18_02595 [Candidatus Kaiserbacteria bacterium CG10_big_fil_rev_8_21_14_0_10_51_14]|uniref:N-acetyltransferase domain-containing protein n=1 Tax=Candidatus Kaiserbacteria bacterium CG10_big_fil_rev_8_21_14_0_10_51_14 TaxID=1974610 RepID=A0A2H0UAW3_9BACT|nr:MAG: hypothetical protein COU18_02595 [Candidatus Kaiserbacteria bacterium CG10_big_fil_rev_8_21_14_0_10_51_14]